MTVAPHASSPRVAERRRQLEVAVLDACVVEARAHAELYAACAIETNDTSDQVQTIRLRVYATTTTRENTVESYVDFLDGDR